MIWTLLPPTLSLTSIVQTLSSRYAIILGGYGPGYTELAQVILEDFPQGCVQKILQVEVVTHDKVCHNVVPDLPPALARFLGDTSGLAEFVDDKVSKCFKFQWRYFLNFVFQVVFCRHTSCWRLDMRNNTWTRSASLHVC